MLSTLRIPNNFVTSRGATVNSFLSVKKINPVSYSKVATYVAKPNTIYC